MTDSESSLESVDPEATEDVVAAPGEQTEKEFELWAEYRRTERRLFLFVLTVLLLTTAYVAFLDGRRLVIEQPQGYQLRFEPSPGETRYRASVLWTRGSPIHPDIMIAKDGSTPGPGDKVPPTNSPSAPVELSLDKTVQIRIVLPPGVAGGIHSGSLLFHRIGDSDNLPAVVSSPVSIEVLSGFWENWRFLYGWLWIVAGFLAVLYAFCVWRYPRPSGNLIVTHFTDTPRERSVRLSMKRLAYLLPWRRSLLRIEELLVRADAPTSLRVRGQLEFLARNKPSLFINPGSNRSLVRRATIPEDGDVTDLGDASFRRIGTVNRIDERVVYRIGKDEQSDNVIMRYRRSR